MRFLIRFELPTGEVVTAGHGAILGRLPQAQLHIADPRVSEAHAMVSMRGRDVYLLALRGRFSVGGKTVTDVVLQPGLEISVAPDLVLRVLEVEAPSHAMALEGPFGRQVLLGPTSVFDGPPRLEHGARPDALAVVWPLDDQWILDDGSTLNAGQEVDVGPFSFTAVQEAVSPAAPTVQTPSFSEPLHIRVRFDTVHIQREGQPTFVLRGIIARILTDLAQAGVPVGWEPLARSIWPDEGRDAVRRRWDMQLVRLRTKLRSGGIRPDLIQPDGRGLVELVLNRGDVVIDEA